MNIISQSRKRVRANDTLALAITHIVEVLDKFMAVDGNKPSAKMIYDEVSKVSGLSQLERLKAGDLFMSDSRKFEYFSCLPVEMRMDTTRKLLICRKQIRH